MDNIFYSRFTWDVMDYLPLGEEVFSFPRNPKDFSQDFVVRIRSENGFEWLGNFHGIDDQYLSGVFPWLNATQVCVVVRGAAYLVQIDAPQIFEELSFVPVIDVWFSNEPKAIIFASFSEIAIYQANGIRLITNGLAIDGIKIKEVRNGKIIGRSSHVERENDFEIDIQTGKTKQ